ncbi:hypothetical protein B0H14DRAFT_3151404 [Mycena olivaceomarginata]|nr:hypothetical protein B0H14DRAFT_3151404 [Mycena olivaceomarginata]
MLDLHIECVPPDRYTVIKCHGCDEGATIAPEFARWHPLCWLEFAAKNAMPFDISCLCEKEDEGECKRAEVLATRLTTTRIGRISAATQTSPAIVPKFREFGVQTDESLCPGIRCNQDNGRIDQEVSVSTDPDFQVPSRGVDPGEDAGMHAVEPFLPIPAHAHLPRISEQDQSSAYRPSNFSSDAELGQRFEDATMVSETEEPIRTSSGSSHEDEVRSSSDPECDLGSQGSEDAIMGTYNLWLLNSETQIINLDSVSETGEPIRPSSGSGHDDEVRSSSNPECDSGSQGSEDATMVSEAEELIGPSSGSNRDDEVGSSSSPECHWGSQESQDAAMDLVDETEEPTRPRSGSSHDDEVRSRLNPESDSGCQGLEDATMDFVAKTEEPTRPSNDFSGNDEETRSSSDVDCDSASQRFDERGEEPAWSNGESNANDDQSRHRTDTSGPEAIRVDNGIQTSVLGKRSKDSPADLSSAAWSDNKRTRYAWTGPFLPELEKWDMGEECHLLSQRYGGLFHSFSYKAPKNSIVSYDHTRRMAGHSRRRAKSENHTPHLGQAGEISSEG